MLETEKQRRWWFATHPEYSSSETGAKRQAQDEGYHGGEKVPPEEVDEYVDYALQHVDGPLAVFLSLIKDNFGTEGIAEEDDGESEALDWLVAGRGLAAARRKPKRKRERRDPGEIRDWFLISRYHREQMEIIEAELLRAGVNPRDYVFTSCQGRIVAQRNGSFDPHQRDPQGRTNIERMKDGRPPLDREGKRVVLHHANQKDEGPMIELTTAEHMTIPIRRDQSQINRQESNSFRRDYWKTRAEALQNH